VIALLFLHCNSITIIQANQCTKLYLLTPWSRVLLKKEDGLQLVKIFPAFYGTPGFKTAFTSEWSNTHAIHDVPLQQGHLRMSKYCSKHIQAINGIKSASRWFHYTDALWYTINQTLNCVRLMASIIVHHNKLKKPTWEGREHITTLWAEYNQGIQDAYKLSEDFEKPYFHKYWTEIHVTTIC
jgi:hypothetical protein